MTRLDELLDGVAGYLHGSEPAYLASLASLVPPGQAIVEIGSFRGRSTIALAYGAQEGVIVWSVDPHEEHSVEGLPFGMADNAAFMANVSRAELGHKVRVINLSSEEVIYWRSHFVDVTIGLVFIDGAHDYASVRYDAQEWGRILSPGGMMALHDANTWEAPARVANELASDTQRWTELAGCAYTRLFKKGEA